MELSQDCGKLHFGHQAVRCRHYAQALPHKLLAREEVVRKQGSVKAVHRHPLSDSSVLQGAVFTAPLCLKVQFLINFEK